MTQALLAFAAVLQALAVSYGLLLLSRRRGAAGAWLFLLGAMSSMLAWRLVVATGIEPPSYFNPLIAIWGSTCMFGAMFFFGREVALRQHAEKERDNLLNSERAARTEAERANRLKDDFLATLSHELRTPLAAILGWCAVLERSKGDPKDLDRALQTIERNARVQARLVDDMLDVARIRAGTLHLELAIVSLQQPVQAALQDLRPEAEAKRLAVTLHCEQDLRVRGDAARLQQVVSNLLVNAVKFTPVDGSITISISKAGNQAQLEVRDNGEGIDPEFVPHLFTRFRQQDSSTIRKHGGLGLGLSIAADLVHLHDGSIDAWSAGPGEGATFTVLLPLALTDSGRGQPEAPLHAAVSATDSSQPLAGTRIVVIDDEEDMRTAVTKLLVQMGADVTPLDSGAAIVEVLERQRPQLLVVDIGMPREDGYTLIRRIRKLPAHSGGNTPAISLTAHAREEDRARALDAGFQEHLPKPIDVARLSRTILQMVRSA